MKKTFVLLFCITMLIVCTVPSFAAFTDLAENAWYFAPIKSACEKNIMNGVSENEFAPNKFITREEFTVALIKAALNRGTVRFGKDFTLPHYEKMSFKDVKPGMWYSDYIEFAYQNGIIVGIGNGNFGIGNYITRQDAAVMLVKNYTYKMHDMPVTKIGFDGMETPIRFGERIADLDKVSDYAKEAVLTSTSYICYQYEIPEEYIKICSPIFFGNTAHEFMPTKYLTRAEAATVFIAYINLPISSSYAYSF